jgi:tetratricopeptide (TPR) repeat protein
LLESLRAADPANQHVGISLATTLLEQAGLLLNTGGGAAALPVIEKTVALTESLGDAITDDYKRAGLFGNTYFTQAMVLNSLGRGPESLAAIDKMVAAIEELARAHPDENKALFNLSSAYGNAGIVSDDRMPRAEQIERSLSLLRKSLSVDETLVAREPDNLEYLSSLAETRFNLGEALYWDEQYEKAVETYRQAYAFFQTGAIDPNDARERYVKASIGNGLAKSLAKVRKFDEAETLFAVSEKSLEAQLSGGDALAVQFALATIGIYRGEMYLLLAADASLSPAVRANYSRKARESLSKGVALARKVDESIKLTADNRDALDLGEASLARAEAELAVVNK